MAKPTQDEQIIDNEQAVSEVQDDMVQTDDALSGEADDIELLDDELSEVEQEMQQIRDQLLRAHAEVENIRRRSERDIAKAHKYGVEKLVKNLLPILDSLEKAEDHAVDNAEAQAIHEGVVLTQKMFLDVLQKAGVECIDPLDDTFDPQQHEAMSIIEHPEKETNTVTQVLQKGYLLNGRLVRPARVMVCK